MSRECLTADLDKYVSVTGSDTADGSFTAPWRTVQYAYDRLVDTVDLSGRSLRLHVTGSQDPFALSGQFIGQRNAQSFRLLGYAATVASTTANAITLQDRFWGEVSGFRVGARGGNPYGRGVLIHGASVRLGGMEYDQCDQAHIGAAEPDSKLHVVGHQTVYGQAGAHTLIEAGARCFYTGPNYCTLMPPNGGGPYGFGYAFARATEGAEIDFTGAMFQVVAAVEGRPWYVESGGIIKGSASFCSPGLPGNQAGFNDGSGVFR